MKRKSKSVQNAPRWRVTRIAGNAARHIIELQADSADDAIRRTIKELGITDPEYKWRLSAYRVA